MKPKRLRRNADLLNETWTQDPRAAELAGWLIHAGLMGHPNTAMLEAYCQKLVELGVPLFRAHVTHNALHPVYGAVGFDWQSNVGPVLHEYARSSEAPENWLLSPFYYMLTQGSSRYRERIPEANAPSRFPLINQMREQGATDYMAAMILFEEWEEGTPLDLEDGHEGAMMSWMADAPDGFSDRDIRLIEATFPLLSLVLKSGTNRKTAQDLLAIYLGRDAGRRVLSGEIQRGSSRWIDAVICYFDLQGFTSMSQKIAGEDLIAMLNDYFGLVVGKIEANGGDVLKFMGDGLIAIFDRESLSDATPRAVRSVLEFGQELDARSAERGSKGLPALGYTVALHSGRVLYGNIGADARLDFTVIGPEVNFAARLSGMHRSLGQDIIMSQDVARDAASTGLDIVSLGRYMLRGVDQPKELFTVHDGQSSGN